MALEWVGEFFRDADMVQIDKLAAWFADDIDLRFANNPPIRDKQTAVAVMGGFYGSIAGMSHKPVHLYAGDDGDTASQYAVVTYTRQDGRDVPLPVSSLLHRNSAGKLDKLWIYIDINPLYAEAEAQ
ncbi:nuclear transport factor 2 family protein [Sphingomonas sp. SRS2]|uniref:nuclear transport factor 2 family protein n=1 Tax=Sphingomonas sp. SRS2 TaxID=133190 RepID=UPI000696E33A|nr:nuclear transport factor 2 family protein [Sphingomonas sp. SRS2]